MKIRALVAAAALALPLAACSTSGSPIAPTSYGAAGQCYYIDDPGEVLALQQAGLCPVNWTPAYAPVWYRNSYAGYWASPLYVDHFVPARVRTVYVTHVHTWNDSNASQIKTAQAKVKAAQQVKVGTSSTSYNVGDRAGGAAKTSTKVSVRTSSRTYSSGSRK